MQTIIPPQCTEAWRLRVILYGIAQLHTDQHPLYIQALDALRQHMEHCETCKAHLHFYLGQPAMAQEGAE